MATVILFHHALGLTEGVKAFADRLRVAGHTVHTPDLFDGETFATIPEGMDHVESIGFGTVLARGDESVAELPDDVVYAGFSLGVVIAQKLAQTRAGALGALLCYSCVPSEEFGGWPDGVPVQVHAMDADPFFVDDGDLEAAQALVEEAGDGTLFLYPGEGHYFADATQPTYDADATALLTERALEFLDTVG